MPGRHRTPAQPEDPRTGSQPVDATEVADFDVVSGDPPVPITVWRTATHTPDDASGTVEGLSFRLACLLLAAYTRRGEAVVDLDDDPQLRNAAERLARGYLTPADLDIGRGVVPDADAARTVSLVVLRWPRPDRAATATGDLFTACRQLLDDADGYAIVAVTAVPAGTPGVPYLHHARILLPAARAAGLGYLQHIVAVTAPIDADRFTYHATASEAREIRADTDQTHLDLLIFVVKGGRRG